MEQKKLIEEGYVSLSYISERVGKTNGFVSRWIRFRPSLKIQKINKREKNHPICLFRKEEADRVVSLIKNRKMYPQEFSPIDSKFNRDNEFSDPAWFVV